MVGVSVGVVYGVWLQFLAEKKMSGLTPGVAGPPTQSAGAAAGPSSTSSTPHGRGGALNASHIERRRQKKKFAVKRLEKKLENYHRQIKRFISSRACLITCHHMYIQWSALHVRHMCATCVHGRPLVHTHTQGPQHPHTCPQGVAHVT